MQKLLVNFAEISFALMPQTIDTLAKMGNSELLLQVLNILKYKKAGKKIIKRFAEFRRDFEDTRKSFHLAYPDRDNDLISSNCPYAKGVEDLSNESTSAVPISEINQTANTA